jgi:hypothetical protein
MPQNTEKLDCVVAKRNREMQKYLIPKQLFLFLKIISVFSITIIKVCGTIKIERKRSLGRLGINGKIILKLIVMKQDGKAWTYSCALG